MGISVIELATYSQMEGVRYLGFRNEQAASYAAGAISYITDRPGACLAVSGPGVVHAIAGLANCWSNCWPMILIGGASDASQDGRGAFQECAQVEAVRPWVKYAARVDRPERIPFFVEQAVRHSLYGRPGPVYLEFPGDVLNGTVEESAVNFPLRVPPAPMTLADPTEVERAMSILKGANRPLVIIGKGAAYARAEHELKAFVEESGLPFLASPMGKGVVSDEHPQCVGAARTQALLNADVILLVGARLNWILHFGLPPRFSPDVKIIQVDICPEEMSTNVPAAARLVGHAKAIVQQLNASLKASPWKHDGPEWRKLLHASLQKNRAASAQLCAVNDVPMSYYRVFAEIRKHIAKDTILVSEGANTMDIGRAMLPTHYARHRLDAGTFGTMGVGMGFAIAAACAFPDQKVVAVEGDSAFGFSGMEMEVACRHKLPICVIIVNNNGIYGGSDVQPDDPAFLTPNLLTVDAHYERIVECFGGKGYFVTTPEQLETVLPEALSQTVPTIVNVMIAPSSQRKAQKFDWLTRDKKESKM
eukprot:TRINITY_DN3705_c0_g1_i2.p1 TRINITY_DN3705_c0_g1~~TRINITY_DN3705_c0_g1_i2.p1  ORF type:complete len:534 (-),score=71.40 TRINITY_DN3705_c0_g1_i2:56-1657(-)